MDEPPVSPNDGQDSNRLIFFLTRVLGPHPQSVNFYSGWAAGLEKMACIELPALHTFPKSGRAQQSIGRALTPCVGDLFVGVEDEIGDDAR